MSVILNIDTSTEKAIISIAQEGKVLASVINTGPNEHAYFLQKGIQQLVIDSGIQLLDIDAIAVAHGPGSYTGIRIGMASAKGLCYVLKKPLIVVSNLEIMAVSAQATIKQDSNYLFCPMLDARRMEVYTAIYDHQLKEILPSAAVILDTGFAKNLLQKNKILFFGNGARKWQQICTHFNAYFENIEIMPPAMSKISYNKLIINDLSSLIYTQPLYLKDFFTGS